MTLATRMVIRVSGVLGEVGCPAAETVLGEFPSGLLDPFGLASAGFLLDERHASIEW